MNPRFLYTGCDVVRIWFRMVKDRVLFSCAYSDGGFFSVCVCVCVVYGEGPLDIGGGILLWSFGALRGTWGAGSEWGA